MNITRSGQQPESSFVPQACTLPTAQQPLRVAEFAQLFTAAVSQVVRASATQLLLVSDGDPAMLTLARDLAARESECCAFFTFTFDTIDGRWRLIVEVPPAHVEVLDGLQALAEAKTRDRQPR